MLCYQWPAVLPPLGSEPVLTTEYESSAALFIGPSLARLRTLASCFQLVHNWACTVPRVCSLVHLCHNSGPWCADAGRRCVTRASAALPRARPAAEGPPPGPCLRPLGMQPCHRLPRPFDAMVFIPCVLLTWTVLGSMPRHKSRSVEMHVFRGMELAQNVYLSETRRCNDRWADHLVPDKQVIGRSLTAGPPMPKSDCPTLRGGTRSPRNRFPVKDCEH